LLGGIILLELAGADLWLGETEPTGPGGGGVGVVAVRLCEPGRTAAVGSEMLALVFPSGFRMSARPF
jgi:hypothetical protein